MIRSLLLAALFVGCAPAIAGAPTIVCKPLFKEPRHLLCKDDLGNRFVFPENCREDAGRRICEPVVWMSGGGDVVRVQAP